MEIFALVGFGLMSVYGLLVWRVAWTGEMPEALRGAKQGWRLRLAIGLTEAPPNRRCMPALILWAWVTLLFVLANAVAKHVTSVVHPVVTALGACSLSMLLTAGVVGLINRPKFIVPPHSRREPGTLAQWLRGGKTR